MDNGCTTHILSKTINASNVSRPAREKKEEIQMDLRSDY